MEALPFAPWERRAGARERAGPKMGRESLPNHTSRSRRAWLLAGGCCSSLLALALPSEAFAQTTDQTAQPAPPADTSPAPADVNTIPPTEPATAIVITGIRPCIQDSIAIKPRERSAVQA